jgi:predicted HTH domain antitoxin
MLLLTHLSGTLLLRLALFLIYLLIFAFIIVMRLKKWVLEGIRAHKLERAVHAYMERETDLRGGAVMADVSYNRFLHEVQKRNIIILDDPAFLDRLGELADAFDNESLRQAVDYAASNS